MRGRSEKNESAGADQTPDTARSRYRWGRADRGLSRRRRPPGRDGDSDADGNDAAGEVRFLPAYDDVLESDAFRTREVFRAHPYLLEKLESVREEIVGDHYGSVDEADLSSPAALYVRRQQFHGGMLNRVVTDSMRVREAYDWGHERLEESLADARERFGD